MVQNKHVNLIIDIYLSFNWNYITVYLLQLTTSEGG